MEEKLKPKVLKDFDDITKRGYDGVSKGTLIYLMQHYKVI